MIMTNETKLFTGEAIRKFKQIGSLLPSSRYLAHRMTKSITPSKKMVVLELGAGTGAITEVILKKLSPDSILIAFEENHGLADFLRKKFRDTRLTIVTENATSLKKYCAFLRIDHVDCIISGVPMGNMNRKDQLVLLQAAKEILADDGIYLQFQYLLASMHIIKEVFPKTKVAFYEVRNFPPAFVIACKKS